MCALTLVRATCRKGGGALACNKKLLFGKFVFMVHPSLFQSSPPPYLSCIVHPIILPFLSPSNQSIRAKMFVFNCFIDVYFLYVLWGCIMQKKLYPSPRSSVDLWIRPPSNPLIHAIIPSSFHPSIPQLCNFKFIQK